MCNSNNCFLLRHHSKAVPKHYIAQSNAPLWLQTGVTQSASQLPTHLTQARTQSTMQHTADSKTGPFTMEPLPKGRMNARHLSVEVMACCPSYTELCTGISAKGM